MRLYRRLGTNKKNRNVLGPSLEIFTCWHIAPQTYWTSKMNTFSFSHLDHGMGPGPGNKRAARHRTFGGSWTRAWAQAQEREDGKTLRKSVGSERFNYYIISEAEDSCPLVASFYVCGFQPCRKLLQRQTPFLLARLLLSLVRFQLGSCLVQKCAARTDCLVKGPIT